uniref:Uncharacterized protein n=1 Tax=Rhinopithecus bieti TaxID=61621 RepID=A0A2K6MZQ9_RHIBE
MSLVRTEGKVSFPHSRAASSPPLTLLGACPGLRKDTRLGPPPFPGWRRTALPQGALFVCPAGSGGQVKVCHTTHQGKTLISREQGQVSSYQKFPRAWLVLQSTSPLGHLDQSDLKV